MILRCLCAAGLAALLTFPASAEELTLSSTGAGTLGQLTVMSVSGTPGDQYLLLLSLNGGPTPLPPPNEPSSIDVGFDLLTLSVGLPGFLGFIPAGGQVDVPLFFPGDPILLAVELHFQALRIVGGLRIDGKSNPWILAPAAPQTTRATLNDMPVLRAGHTSTTLPDGRVLLVGGGPDGIVASFGQASVEIYEPGTQTFEVIGQLNQPRASHTTTLLPDGHTVLVTGGAEDVLGEPTKTAELFDIDTGVSTTIGSLTIERGLHGAALLGDGRVLLFGGTSSFNSAQDIVENAMASTEFYNPGTNTFTPGPAMSEPRVGNRVDVLNDGRVLITGGFTWTEVLFLGKVPFVSDTAQVYTPQAGLSGTYGPTLTMNSDRFGHNSILLDDGNVLIVGGAIDFLGSPFDPIPTDSLEIYDAGSNMFLPAGLLSKARGASAVAKLPNGTVLIAGGATGALSVPSPDDTVDFYDPVSQTLLGTTQLLQARANFTANTLPDGTVLLAGGGELPNNDNPSLPFSLDTAEIAHP